MRFHAIGMDGFCTLIIRRDELATEKEETEVAVVVGVILNASPSPPARAVIARPGNGKRRAAGKEGVASGNRLPVIIEHNKILGTG